MKSNSTAILIKIKLSHSLGRPSRSDFVQSKFLNIIPYLSISSKETLINKFQIINSKKLQKEIDSVMDILLTDNVSK